MRVKNSQMRRLAKSRLCGGGAAHFLNNNPYGQLLFDYDV